MAKPRQRRPAAASEPLQTEEGDSRVVRFTTPPEEMDSSEIAPPEPVNMHGFTPNYVTPDEELGTAENALMNMIADLQGEDTAQVTVWRAGPKYHSRMAFVDSFPPDEFSFERLRDEYGGGMFRIHVRRNNVIILNRLINVEPPARKRAEEATAQQPTVILDALKEMQRGQMQMMQAMKESTDRTLAGMMQMMQSQNQIGVKDILEIMTREPARREPPQTLDGLIDTFVKFQSLMGPRNVAPATDPASTITTAMELARMISGDVGAKSESDVFHELIKQFGPPIAQAVMQGAQAKAQPMQQAPSKRTSMMARPMPQQVTQQPMVQKVMAAPPVPTGRITQPNLPDFQVEELQEGEQPMQEQIIEPADVEQFIAQLLGPHLSKLNFAAQTAIPAEQAANMVMEKMPEDYDNIVYDFLHQPNWLDVLVANGADMTHREWYENLRLAILTMYSDDDTVGEEGMEEEPTTH